MSVTVPRSARSASKRGESLLGYVCWSGFSDKEVPLSTVRRHWGLAGLPMELVPKETKALHAFKRAVSSLEGHGGIERTTHIHVDKVNETDEDCVYQVAFVVRDLELREATYPRACKFIFQKDTEKNRNKGKANKVDFAAMQDGIKRSDLLPVTTHVADAYEQGLTRVSGSQVRALIREFIRTTRDETRGKMGLGGENISEGNSVYFVRAEHRDYLESLQSFVFSLAKSQHSHGYLNMVELFDRPKDREMIARHVAGNVDEALEKAIAAAKVEIAKNKSGDRLQALREDKKSNMFAEARLLLQRAKSHEHLLEDQMSDLERKAEILRQQLDKLL